MKKDVPGAAFSCMRLLISILMRILGLSIQKKSGATAFLTLFFAEHCAPVCRFHSHECNRAFHMQQMSRYNRESKREICFKLSADDAKKWKINLLRLFNFHDFSNELSHAQRISCALIIFQRTGPLCIHDENSNKTSFFLIISADEVMNFGVCGH